MKCKYSTKSPNEWFSGESDKNKIIINEKVMKNSGLTNLINWMAMFLSVDWRY
jgi:hypothetical protein